VGKECVDPDLHLLDAPPPVQCCALPLRTARQQALHSTLQITNLFDAYSKINKLSALIVLIPNSFSANVVLSSLTTVVLMSKVLENLMGYKAHMQHVHCLVRILHVLLCLVALQR
jgi:hypothetical protein